MTRALGTYGNEAIAHAVARYSSAKITELQGLYLRRSGAAYHDALAALAALRKNEGISPWMQVGNMFLADLFNQWDEIALGALDDEPQPAVVAFETALHLYAIHQHSKNMPVHAPQSAQDSGQIGKRFGAACYELAKRSASADSVERRMAVVDSISDFPGMARSMRSLITMMRSADSPIVLDYGALARDLYLMQFPGSKPSVMHRWAGDYFHAKLHDQVLRNGENTPRRPQ